MRQKAPKNNIKVKEGEKEDPLLRLGLGIYVYLNLMKQLVLLFLLLTVLCIPILVFYGKNDAYKTYSYDDAGNDILLDTGSEIFSLGNLGYSST